jgi:hypothetical protein
MKVLKRRQDGWQELTYHDLRRLILSFFKGVGQAVRASRVGDKPDWYPGQLAHVYAQALSVIHCISIEAIVFGGDWPSHFVPLPFRGDGLWFQPGEGLSDDEVEMLARYTFTCMILFLRREVNWDEWADNGLDS